jgi:hypothetical protein
MTAYQGSERYPTTVSATALAMLVLMALLLAGAPLYTEDLWWHLKAGEMYVTEGPWPESDWMLHTASDDAPIQHEWLFGVSVFALERLLGFHGLRIVHAAAVALILWLVYSICRRAGQWPVAACFATALFITLAWFRLFQFRPDLISILGTLAGYRLLLEGGERPSWLRTAAYTLLIGVWVNFHSLFLVSLNLLFAAILGVALAAGLERFLGRADEQSPARALGRRQLATRLATALVLGLIVALLNPRGVEQHLTFFASTENTAIWHVTDEWSHFSPFDFGANHSTVSLPMWLAVNATMLGFLAVAVTAFVRFSRLRTARALDDFDPVRFGLGLAAIVAMLVSIRFLWMCVFPLLYVLHAFTWMRAGRHRCALGAAWMMALASVLMAVWFSVGYGFANLAARFVKSPIEYFSLPYRTHKFHVEGVRFLAESRLEGNLFNSYAMGGFLGYWLSPRLRTFVDSRAEHYGNDVYLDYSAVTEMLGTRPGESFIDVLDRRNVDIFFGIGFPGWWHSVFTTNHLYGIPGWLLVSRSFRHAIYLRDNARNRENLKRVAAYYEAQGVPFDAERGLDPGAVIRSRPDWAMQRSLLPSDYPELLALAESGDPETRLKARNAVALVYLLGGAIDEQIAWDRQTAREFPHNRSSRQRLVYGLLRKDAAEEAQSVAEALVAMDPGDRWSRDLARLVNDYRRLGRPATQGAGDNSVQILRNHLLWKMLPATASETWAVEHAMATEALSPAPGAP